MVMQVSHTGAGTQGSTAQGRESIVTAHMSEAAISGLLDGTGVTVHTTGQVEAGTEGAIGGRYCNTAPNKDAGACCNPLELQGVTTPKKPEGYYYRLAVDTLQVAVVGNWHRKDGADDLLAARRRAEMLRDAGLGGARWNAPDGTELEVYPHGGRPNYQVLMKDAAGLELRALPKGRRGMPTFIIRFGARWCVENTITELGEWVYSLCAFVGFTVEAVKLSEVHVRCDVPTPFVDRDLKLMRGNGTRNQQIKTHQYQNQLTGFNNLGGEKPFKFVVYDKVREQLAQKGTVHWRGIWESYGISAQMPVWRIEARWKREALAERGLDVLGDLTPASIGGLWYWFTRKYLYFVMDPRRSSNRTATTRKWARIQACGQMAETAPLPKREEVTATQLVKQAVGCTTKALAVSGAGSDQAEIDRVLQHVATTAQGRYAEERTAAIIEAVCEALGQPVTADRVLPGSLGPELRDGVRRGLETRLISRPGVGPSQRRREVAGGELIRFAELAGL